MLSKSKNARAREFETAVAAYYESLGYTARLDITLGGQQIDVLATLRLPDGQSHSLIVECKYHGDGRASGNADVQSIAHAFALLRDNHLVDGCVLVTSSHFSHDAQVAAAVANIHLLTAADLIRLTHRVPLAYALPLQARYASARLNVPYFVPGHGRRRKAREAISDVAEELRRNALSDDRRFTLLFGAVGTGKTTQMIALGERLTSEYLAGAAVPLGIYIPLERFLLHRSGQYFDEFIVHYLRTHFRMPNVCVTDIAQWLSSRSAVLILDGFDEIVGLDSEIAITNEFDHIVSSVGANATATMSCRTALAARAEIPLPRLMTEHLVQNGIDRMDVIELSLLAPAEVNEYVRAVGLPKSALAGISKQILRRPLFLSMVTATLDGRRPITRPIDSQSALIEHCVSHLLRWKISLRYASVTEAQWRTFLENAALTMLVEKATHISVARLRELVVAHFGSPDDVDRLRKLDFDASVRTILDFDLTTRGLRWSHVIFRDFLAAGAIARHLLSPEASDTRLDGILISPEEVEFVQYHVARGESRALRDFLRPTSAPRSISEHNRWRWVCPGLTLISDLPDAGGRLTFFKRGFWVSEHPITIGDAIAMGSSGWISEEQVRLAPDVPLTHVTHTQSAQLAAALGTRLPTDAEWERAARWIDGSFPRQQTIPVGDRSSKTPPSVVEVEPNPWGVKNTVGCVWQWTATFDVSAQRYVCRGLWWGATHEAKLRATSRLLPREPDHIRTGVRFFADPVSGGEL